MKKFKATKKQKHTRAAEFSSKHFDVLGSYTGTGKELVPEQDADDL
jgi:hypothetical protein